MVVSNSLRSLAGAALVVLSFNSAAAESASLAPPAHPILDAMNGHTAYSGRLLKEFDSTATTTDQGFTAGSRGGTFISDLEAKLKTPMDRPQSVTVPTRKAYVTDLSISGVVPPKAAYATANIPVCMEQNGKILGTWAITPTGQVKPDRWTGASTSPVAASGQKVELACKDYLLSRGKAMTAPVAAAKGGDKLSMNRY